MSESKEDKRVVKTRALIRSAYLTCLKKLGFKKTTVKEICDEAYISRKTFYSHYETIQSLFEEVMDECLSYQDLEVGVNIHLLQVELLEMAPEAYRRKAQEFLVSSGRKVLKYADELRIFFELDDPYVNEYIRRRCLDPQLPIRETDSIYLKMSRDLIGAERYTALRALVMNPDIDIDEMAAFQARAMESYIHLFYTNSDTFRSTYGLPKGKDPI